MALEKSDLVLLIHSIAILGLIFGHYSQNLAIENILLYNSEKHKTGDHLRFHSNTHTVTTPTIANVEEGNRSKETEAVNNIFPSTSRASARDRELDHLNKNNKHNRHISRDDDYDDWEKENKNFVRNLMKDQKKNEQSIVDSRENNKRNKDRDLSRDFHTLCVPVVTNDQNLTTSQLLMDSYNKDNSEEMKNTDFKIRLELMTNAKPERTSWTLLHHKEEKNQQKEIIDSKEPEYFVELSQHSLYEFEYHCVVTGSDTELSQHADGEEKEKEKEKYCYDFEVYEGWHEGLCCRYGLGYYKLYYNDDSTALYSDRMHNTVGSLSTFCVDEDGNLVSKEEENHVNGNILYPSRQCIDNKCVCDSNPNLFVNFDEDNDSSFDIKMRVLLKIMSLSGSDKLLDVKTPQYKAACWVLNDDPFLAMKTNSNDDASNNVEGVKAEKRMIQRYILALFYFATGGPMSWTHHFHFLSSKSECEWNSVEDYYSGERFIDGSLCDEDNNIYSLTFWNNNIDGSIVEELYGLTKLESFVIQGSENLKGTIPSSIGRLSELRCLWLLGKESLLEGTIPPELFEARNINSLLLGRTNLHGKIPESIGNLSTLSVFVLYLNNLSGEIPEQVYSLKEIIYFALNGNAFTSTLSSSLGNLKKLEQLWLENNFLYGEIPNSIDSLSSIQRMTLHENNLIGKIPDQLCDVNSPVISSDCRNDILEAKVECSCCSICYDSTPVWYGDCADTTLSVKIDHAHRFHPRGYVRGNSDDLTWGITNERTGIQVFQTGPYERLKNIREEYKSCVSSSGCFSLNMLSAPREDTGYSILLDENTVYEGHFNSSSSPQEMMTFQYDTINKEATFSESPLTCEAIKITCGNETINLEPNTTQQIMYSAATKASGVSKIHDQNTAQSKALCWIVNDENFNKLSFNKETRESLHGMFVQRYVLSVLHLTSIDGIFGTDEYPPSSGECGWNGVSCSTKDKKWKTVTEISLSPELNQMIGGTLIKELGSLAYLEKLTLAGCKVDGPIHDVLSNLWSLRELDLSSNTLKGTIPKALFNEPTQLEYLDLSQNMLSNTIPNEIGEHSNLVSIALSENQLIGSIPLNGENLQFLDVSENKLNAIEISKLLNHRSLETVNLGSNFFATSLPEDLFVSLPKLKYFNVSQNEIDGPIPAKYTTSSNITHLDMHGNRISGTIPIGITELLSIEHLNLQGNKLTGSIPKNLNDLKKLEILALSNNELKGSIPLDLIVSLPSIDSLYLHNNKLSGKAPLLNKNKKMRAYYTDCGFPSLFGEPVDCQDCDICCNADQVCQRKADENARPGFATLLFIFFVIAFLLACYIFRDCIKSISSFNRFLTRKVRFWHSMDLISQQSIYSFMLTTNTVGWLTSVGCIILQIVTLFIFMRGADIRRETSDLQYTMICPSNSLDCDDSRSLTAYGTIMSIYILLVWLLRDIVCSGKLMLLALERGSPDFLFASSLIFLVTSLSVWTSIYYNVATATTDTELIVNAVILLFVNEIDERLYELAETCNPKWVRDLNASFRASASHTQGDNLLLANWAKKTSDHIGKMKRRITNEREPVTGSEIEEPEVVLDPNQS